MATKTGILSDSAFSNNCLEYQAFPVGFANADYEGNQPNPFLPGVKMPKYTRAAPKPISADVKAVNASRLLGGGPKMARAMLNQYQKEAKEWKPPTVTLVEDPVEDVLRFGYATGYFPDMSDTYRQAIIRAGVAGSDEFYDAYRQYQLDGILRPYPGLGGTRPIPGPPPPILPRANPRVRPPTPDPDRPRPRQPRGPIVPPAPPPSLIGSHRPYTLGLPQRQPTPSLDGTPERLPRANPRVRRPTPDPDRPRPRVRNMNMNRGDIIQAQTQGIQAERVIPGLVVAVGTPQTQGIQAPRVIPVVGGPVVAVGTPQTGPRVMAGITNDEMSNLEEIQARIYGTLPDELVGNVYAFRVPEELLIEEDYGPRRPMSQAVIDYNNLLPLPPSISSLSTKKDEQAGSSASHSQIPAVIGQSTNLIMRGTNKGTPLSLPTGTPLTHTTQMTPEVQHT